MSLVKYKVDAMDDNTYKIEQRLLISSCLCYLLVGDDRAVLIDSASKFDGLKAVVDKLTDKPVTVLNTHGHADHIGCNYLFDDYWLNENDQDVFALHNDIGYLTGLMHGMVPAVARPLLRKYLNDILHPQTNPNAHYFSDGHRFDIGGRKLVAIETPGHTPGSTCFLEEGKNRIYSGDTVCDMGVLLHLEGCTTTADFLASIQKVDAIADDKTEFYPGHRLGPIDRSFLDDYIRCAQGILDGSLPAKPQTEGDRHFFATAYGRVQITHRGE